MRAWLSGISLKDGKSPTMSEEEILEHVRNAYRAEKNNFGTLEFNVY